MKKIQICRLMFFAVLGIACAMMLVGLIAPDLAPYQMRRWMTADALDVQTTGLVAQLLARINQGIQLVLLATGGLLAILSLIGLWCCGPATGSELTVQGVTQNNSRGISPRMPQFAAFALLFVGLGLAFWGQTVDADSFQMDAVTASRDRELAQNLKLAGMVMALAAPAVWAIGGLFCSRPQRY